MIEYIFIDLDETLLDFKRAEREAVAMALKHFGIEPEENTLALYSRLNLAQWKLLEQQKLTLPEVKQRRFELLFEELGSTASPTQNIMKNVLQKAPIRFPERRKHLKSFAVAIVCFWLLTEHKRFRNAGC